MRIVFWNILHGGGARIPEIALALLELKPDVIGLSEFRQGRGGQLAAVLHDHGLTHQARSTPGPTRNGLLLAARDPVAGLDRPDPSCVGARVGVDEAVNVTVCHIPDGSGGRAGERRRADAWRAVLRRAADDRTRAHLIVGDLNAGKGAIDGPSARRATSVRNGERLGKLTQLGFQRVLSESDQRPTWVSNDGEGFCLDHAYYRSGGETAPCARGAALHSVRFSGLSDHSALLIETV